MGQVTRIEANEIFKKYMTEFYADILVHRAIPDTRDGLIEAQRRALYAMWERGYTSKRAYVKGAKCTSAAMTYHMHGDGALYDTIAFMSQSWKNHIPWIEPMGNNGSVYGDAPAAGRYLELRLDKNCENLLLDEIKKDCVDFIPSYDNDGEEPSVLPSKLPMYLINGAFGIVGGYSVSVPTHNPNEVIKETIKLMKNPEYKVNLRPDLPTGGLILNDDSLDKSYNTGRSNFKLRARILHDVKKHELVITELPQGLTTMIKLKENLKVLCNDTYTKQKNKKVKVPAVIQGVNKVKDGSSKNIIKLRILVNRNYSLEQIEKDLYKYAGLEATIPFIMLGVVDGKFKEYNNANQVLQEWIDFRISTIKRIKQNSIKKWSYRIHIIEGLLKILDPKTIDVALKKIRACKNKNNVINMLIEDYKLTNKQAEAIAEMMLYKLSNGNIDELKNERITLKDNIDNEIKYFKDKSLIAKLIIADLEEIDKKIKSKRTTEIVEPKDWKSFNKDDINSIPDEEYGILVSKDGYIKKRAVIKSQKRNGKGYTIGKMKEGDYIVSIGNINNRDFLYICTDAGKMYKFRANDFMETGTNLGTCIKSKINGENISTVLRIPYDADFSKYNILTVTRQNKIKMSALSEYSNIGSAGLLTVKLNEGDSLVSCLLIDTTKESRLILANNLGNTIMISTNDIPVVNRVTMGVAAFHNDILNHGGEIVSADFVRTKDIHGQDDTHVLVVASNGLGKLVDINEFYSEKEGGVKALQRRGTKGIMATKLREGSVLVSAKSCCIDEQVTLVSNTNVISMELSEISIVKRPTFGSKLMNLGDGEVILDITIP